MNLYRTDSLGVPFALVSNIDVSVHKGLYEDEGLTNGTKYYYYIEAEDVSGRTSVPESDLRRDATRRSRPTHGDAVYQRRRSPDGLHVVDLTDGGLTRCYRDEDRERGRLLRAPWQAYNPSVTATLSAFPSDGDHVEVHVLLRDPVGNVTRICDTIVYVDTSSSGAFFGSIVLPLDVVNAGCMIPAEGPMDLRANDAPFGRLPAAAEPGEYVVRIVMRGYESVDFAPMMLNPGDNVDLGIIELVPVDGDGDGLYDVDELLPHDTHPARPIPTGTASKTARR